MDNHPIPQDVTNFQFHLIGDMTIKQFSYIVAGVVFAWVMLASPLFIFLKLFFAGGCVLASVILAFVPIEGRPSDIMILHFLKALFTPTQYMYTKTVATQNTPQQKLPTQQVPEPEMQKPVAEKEEKVQLQSFTPTATAAIQNKADEASASPQTPPMQPTPAPSSDKEAKLQHEAQQLTKDLALAKAEEAHVQQGTNASLTAHEKVTSLEQELQEVQKEKQELERQLIALQKSLAQNKGQVFTPTTAKETPSTQHVKKISKQMSVNAGVPLVPDVPNLLIGVVKDPRGNVLSNVLIEVKDKDSNPVRAFKTNQLGQFAAATPLTSGTYTISFEDPEGKQTFDSVEITASGDILSPLEITSIDAREKLRQELFGAA